MVLGTLGKACLLFYNCVIAEHAQFISALPLNAGETGWVELEGRLPSLLLPHRSLGDTGAAAGAEEELTAKPAPGAFIRAPLSEGLRRGC